MTIWTLDYFLVCFSNILITFPRFPSSSGTSKSCTRSVPHLAKLSNSYLSHTQEPPCRGSYQAQIIHSPIFYGDIQVLIHKLPLPTPEVQGGFDEAPAASVDPARVIPGAALWCCDCKGKKPKQRSFVPNVAWKIQFGRFHKQREDVVFKLVYKGNVKCTQSCSFQSIVTEITGLKQESSQIIKFTVGNFLLLLCLEGYKYCESHLRRENDKKKMSHGTAAH